MLEPLKSADFRSSHISRYNNSHKYQICPNIYHARNLLITKIQT